MGKRMKLEDLKIQSFVTNLTKIKGGDPSDYCGTYAQCTAMCWRHTHECVGEGGTDESAPLGCDNDAC